jgi:hypothetical protein
MSVLLVVTGALAAMVGVGMVGYGIPINEFSFGNTLIVSGTTAVIGGLIIIAIGVAVGKLQRIANMLASSAPGRGGDMFAPEAGARAAPAPSHMPFPLGPKPEAAVPEVQPHNEPAIEVRPVAAPMLRNPERPAVAAEQLEVEEYEAVSLSPQQPAPATAEPDALEPPSSISDDAMPVAGMRPVPPLEPPPWHTAPPSKPPERPSQPSYFDAMWPAEPRPQKREPPKPEAPKLQVPEPPKEQVAILKSGVVDGMAYTLYVDGSIEAELPQGTLHFASINELRDHLARNS